MLIVKTTSKLNFINLCRRYINFQAKIVMITFLLKIKFKQNITNSSCHKTEDTTETNCLTFRAKQPSIQVTSRNQKELNCQENFRNTRVRIRNIPTYTTKEYRIRRCELCQRSGSEGVPYRAGLRPFCVSRYTLSSNREGLLTLYVTNATPSQVNRFELCGTAYLQALTTSAI